MRFKPNMLLGIGLLLVLAPIASAKTLYVNGVSGNNLNNCLSTTTACKTIRRAILLAASGDTIRVAAATYKENLTIARNLTIVGAGAATTIIDGRRSSTVVAISTTAHVTISNVTLRNGAGTSVAGTREGGGILNQGTLQLINSTVSGNTVLTTNCEFCSATGGGIYNSTGATATISRSTITGNTASYTLPNSPCGAWGGGISNNGTVTISNSTLSDNTAYCDALSGGVGGGISNGGAISINNSTISHNTANGLGGGISNFSSNTLLQNTIVANSPQGGNCYFSVTSEGYNLSSDDTCGLIGAGDVQNTDPLLGPLQKNGGPTQTMALLPGSPAIDAGNPSGCTDSSGHLLKTDQRGMPRPDKEDTGGCDIGAFEKQSD
jgi:hypothetical protein